MPTKKAVSKKVAKKTTVPPASDMRLLAEAVSSIATEVGAFYHFSSLADHVAELASQVGFAARSHTLAAIAQFGNAQDKTWALERLKMLVDDRH